MDPVAQEGQLISATFPASFPVSVISYSIIEILCFIIYHINSLDNQIVHLLAVVWATLINLLFYFIYAKRKRYEYIISTQYKPFTLSINWGMFICFLVTILSLLELGFVTLKIDALMAK
jgi:hypothetical protein